MPDKRSTKKTTYENNPFFIATSGITLLFNLAQGVAVMLIIFAVVSFFGNAALPNNSGSHPASSNSLSDAFQGWGSSEWLLFSLAIGIIGLAIIMVGSLFAGVNAYTAARIARGEQVAIGEAFREAFNKLWSFIWLQLIIFVKIFLWSLLLIVPGVIMAVRYSLAGVAFFDDTKNLRGNAAIEESLRLTKGAWITTYASFGLFNIITFGIIGNLVNTGVSAILYRQYQDAGDKKPAAHFLSWLSLVLPFVLFGLIFFGLIFIAVIVGLLGQHTA